MCYFACTGDTLSIVTLHLIKWKDKSGKVQTFRLVDRVSASWKDFGLLLKLEMNVLKAWDDLYRGDANMCWARVMEHWLTHEGDHGDYPPSWEGLYALLNDAEYSVVAEELRKAVDGASLVAEESEEISVEDDSNATSDDEAPSTGHSDGANSCKCIYV